MKRVFIIALLLVLSIYNGVSQFSSIGGELRYQHQYQDAYSGGAFYKLVRKNPQFILGTAGYILSPMIFSFDARTNININYNTSSFAGVNSSYKQTVIGFYDLNVNALQRLPVRLSFSARDQQIKSSSQFSKFNVGFNDYRQQQQRIELSTMSLKFLPTTSVAYQRNRHWSDLSLNRFNQVMQELIVNMSQSTQDGSFSLSGSLSENYESFTNNRLRYLRFQMSGNKEFSPNHHADITSEYYKFENTSMINANGIYNGTLFEKFRLNTNILTRNASSQSASSTTLGIGQTIQFLQNENFNYAISFGNQSTYDIYLQQNGSYKQRTDNLTGTGTIQHMRSISDITFSNGLSFGYAKQVSLLGQRSYVGGLTNSLQTTSGGYQINVNQSFNMTRIKGYLGRDEINNMLNMTLGKTLPYEINSQTGVEFHNERRSNTNELFYKYQTIKLREQLNMSLYLYSPFTISVEGSISWISNGISGHLYGLMANINSGRFFIQDLSMNYRLNRSYDIYYRRPYFEQTIEFVYGWRALAFQLRLQEFRFIDTRHDIWFSIARPFNIGL
ncbi:MAG: hypothetical protein HZB59_13025 [Ignavibacteriales bacterium]|nr:hypothetical protein [Ignavibacteriales bacterium]